MVPSSIFTGNESDNERRGRRSTSRRPGSRPHFSAAVSNWRIAIRNELRSSSGFIGMGIRAVAIDEPDRKSTRLNSSHRCISYAVFCLKKKKKKTQKNKQHNKMK